MAKLIQVNNTLSQEIKICVRPLNHFVRRGDDVQWLYFCPVCCEAEIMLGIDEGDSNCSCCGINLFGMSLLLMGMAGNLSMIKYVFDWRSQR